MHVEYAVHAAEHDVIGRENPNVGDVQA
jgi:hypothetical protein